MKDGVDGVHDFGPPGYLGERAVPLESRQRPVS